MPTIGPRTRISVVSDDVPTRLVLDAGPLIALFHKGDRDHAVTAVGFDQLALAKALVISPLPIVFEVYKWLLFHVGASSAQESLRQMRGSLEVLYLGRDDFDAAAALSGSVSNWAGTLEDATVVLTSLRLGLPVWTLNYRDLSAFPRLRFWSPC